MKHLVLTILSASLFTISGFSQIDSYDISKYVRPNLHREQLIMVNNLNFNNNNLKVNDEDLTSRFAGGTTNELSKSTFINSDSLQATSSWSGNLNFDFQNTDNSSKHNLSAGYKINREARYYRKENKFIQFDFEISSVAARNRNKTDVEKLIDKRMRGTGSTSISLGTGRLEYVTDAWQAVTILDALRDLDLLIKNDLDHEFITLLADKIAEVKNKRFTDPRFFFINEYEEVISFLDEHQVIDTQDHKFFGQFYDLWRNERFISRRHGKTFRYGVGTNVNNESLFTDQPTRGGAEIFIEFENFNAKTKDWQINKVYGISLNAQSNDLFEISPNQQLRTFFNYSLGYYPNLRTNYVVGFDVNYLNQINSTEGLSFFDNDRLSCSLFGVYNYYVSPQLTWRLSGNFNLISQDVEGINTNLSNNNNVSFRTIYAFF